MRNATNIMTLIIININIIVIIIVIVIVIAIVIIIIGIAVVIITGIAMVRMIIPAWHTTVIATNHICLLLLLL